MSIPATLPSPCYVVSDHHFGAAPPESEDEFVDFLGQISGRVGSLVINGDLFDFWFEWRSVIPGEGYRVLAALHELRRKGTAILWIGGNHDCWGGGFLQERVGVEYMLGTWEGEIAGFRTRIDHGDGLRPLADRKYRALRAVIRHPLAIAGMRLLHPDLGSWLARRSSSASRVHRAHDEGAELREVARSVLQKEPKSNTPELYILGHTHVAALERFAEGGVYANAGAWSEGGTHLVIEPGRITLRGFSASAGWHDLHVVNR